MLKGLLQDVFQLSNIKVISAHTHFGGWCAKFDVVKITCMGPIPNTFEVVKATTKLYSTLLHISLYYTYFLPLLPPFLGETLRDY